MSAETRRALQAGLSHTATRLDRLEQRVALLDRLAFELEQFGQRLARLEQRPPPPFAGPELRRMRDEEILALRAEGRSLAAISQRIGLSKSAVSRAIHRNGNDPAPERVVGTGGGRYYARLTPAHPRSRNGTGRPVRLEGIDRTSGDHVTVYGELSVFPR